MKTEQELFEEVISLDRGERLTQEQRKIFLNGKFKEPVFGITKIVCNSGVYLFHISCIGTKGIVREILIPVGEKEFDELIILLIKLYNNNSFRRMLLDSISLDNDFFYYTYFSSVVDIDLSKEIRIIMMKDIINVFLHFKKHVIKFNLSGEKTLEYDLIQSNFKTMMFRLKSVIAICKKEFSYDDLKINELEFLKDYIIDTFWEKELS